MARSPSRRAGTGAGVDQGSRGTDERCAGDGIGRVDRRGVGAAFCREGLRPRRHRQRHAPASSSATRPAPRGAASASKPRCTNYRHLDVDIRDADAHRHGLRALRHATIAAVIHTAAQPSHDWAARDPSDRFHRQRQRHAEPARSDAPALPRGAPSSSPAPTRSMATRPIALPLVEQETRWEVDPAHPSPRTASTRRCAIDHACTASSARRRLAADVMVQEYGRYFGMKTACFRGGCLTGPGHSGTMLHGFLAYLVKCAVTGDALYACSATRANRSATTSTPTTWSARSGTFFQQPRSAEVYNIGGSRHATARCSRRSRCASGLTGRPMNWSLRRGQSRRRPHLVDQRRAQFPGPLSGLALSLRHRRDAGGNHRRACVEAEIDGGLNRCH